jgi:hypothetical protein
MPAALSLPAPRGSAWDSQFFLAGVNGEVRAIANSGNSIYVGGQFNSADDIVLTNIAKWNGTNWSALGSGVNGAVNAIAIDGSFVYAAGQFTSAGTVPANRITRWNGTNWSALGSGIAGTRVTALAVDALRALYAGGEFTNASGVVVANIAKWDGTNWSALGSGLSNDPYAAWVVALAMRGTDLYAGGFFTEAGGVSVSCIAKWNGTAWSALGAGVDDLDYVPQVTALAVKGNDLYVGGAFTRAGGASVGHVARWNGTDWSAVGTGLTRYFGDIPVAALGFNEDDLLVGGRFEMAGGSSATNIARWNGSAWSQFAGGARGTVKSIAADVSGVHVGGSFTAGNVLRPLGIVQWSGTSCSNVSAGGGKGLYGPTSVGDTVNAVAVNGSNVFVAGGFSVAGDSNVWNVARWDGVNWWPLGGGVNGPVYALAFSGTTLFAGGDFDSAGGVSATSIAQWNGTSWAAVGNGIAGTVQAFAVSGNELYAAGAFATAGGISASNIARWTGSAWLPLGSGINGPVYALAVTGSVVYAGGKFTSAGVVNATNLARWSGSAWSAVSGGVGGIANPIARIRPPPVSALALSGSDVYIGGDFAWAGGIVATNLARWDGTQWHAVGAGVTGIAAFAPPPAVAALRFHGEELVVGGSFNRVGNLSALNLARWDGTNWSSFGEGLSGGINSPSVVRALAVSGARIYAGGHFKFAGGKPASDFAIWQLSISLRIARLGEEVQLSWPLSAGSFILEESETLASWQAFTNTLVSTGEEAAVTSPASGARRFYRLRKQ